MYEPFNSGPLAAKPVLNFRSLQVWHSHDLISINAAHLQCNRSLIEAWDSLYLKGHVQAV